MKEKTKILLLIYGQGNFILRGSPSLFSSHGRGIGPEECQQIRFTIDFSFSEFLRFCFFAKYFYLVFRDPSIDYLLASSSYFFFLHRLSLNVPFKMVFSNLILRSKAPRMKKQGFFS